MEFSTSFRLTVQRGFFFWGAFYQYNAWSSRCRASSVYSLGENTSWCWGVISEGYLHSQEWGSGRLQRWVYIGREGRQRNCGLQCLAWATPHLNTLASEAWSWVFFLSLSHINGISAMLGFPIRGQSTRTNASTVGRLNTPVSLLVRRLTLLTIFVRSHSHVQRLQQQQSLLQNNNVRVRLKGAKGNKLVVRSKTSKLGAWR